MVSTFHGLQVKRGGLPLLALPSQEKRAEDLEILEIIFENLGTNKFKISTELDYSFILFLTRHMHPASGSLLFT